MILCNLLGVFLWLLTADANSEFSALFYKDSSKNQSALCSESVIIEKWREVVRDNLGTELTQRKDSTNETVVRASKWRRKNPVVVKLSNKRRRKPLVRIVEETQYKIDVMNKLSTKTEVLLIVDFPNKTECGVGAFTPEQSNSTETQMNSSDSTKCLSVELSIEPRRRISYPFITPKCGCFIFRYHIAFNKENATVIKTPHPSSEKQHKKLTKIFCIQNSGDEDSEFDRKSFKKHQRRRGKKGFFKKNRKMNRRPNKFSRRMRKVLSRSKKDLVKMWNPQDKYNPPQNSTDKDFKENEYIVEDEVRTDEAYNSVYPVDRGLIQNNENEEDLDEYVDDEDERIDEDEERNLVEGYEYEDDSTEDEIKYLKDYENEDVGEDDYEYGDDTEDVDEDVDGSDEGANEIDDVSTLSYNENDGVENNIFDDANENKEDNSCESDESEESSEEEIEIKEEEEEEEEEKEAENDKNEYHDNKIDAYEEKINNHSIPPSVKERDDELPRFYNNRNYRGPRPNMRRKTYRITYNNGIKHRHRFPMKRVNDFRIRRQRQPFKPFNPWELSNRAKWQRKHGINPNSLKASSICCRHGVNRKRLILHNRLENNYGFNETCEETSTKFSRWVQQTFNVTEEFCFDKFRSCCNDWSLISANFRPPYFPMRRNVLY